MSGRITLATERRRRKLKSLLWMVLATAVVVFLIYKQMTAILYIVSTLGVTALLVAVALADLAHSDTPVGDGADVAKRPS